MQKHLRKDSIRRMLSIDSCDKEAMREMLSKDSC